MIPLSLTDRLEIRTKRPTYDCYNYDYSRPTKPFEPSVLLPRPSSPIGQSNLEDLHQFEFPADFLFDTFRPIPQWFRLKSDSKSMFRSTYINLSCAWLLVSC